MRFEYDARADALYIYVTLQDEVDVARSEDVGDERLIDFDADGHVVGIEVVSPSAGFTLLDLINRFPELAPYDVHFKELEHTSFHAVA